MRQDHDTVKETVAAQAPELPKGLRRPISRIAKRQLPDDVVRKGRAPSNWAKKKPSERTFLETLAAIDLAPATVYADDKQDIDRGPVPTRPIWRENVFIICYGLWPVFLQMASYAVFPDFKWNAWAAYGVYFVAFFVFITRNVKRLHRFMVEYGTFDEKERGRDIVSDHHVKKLALTILMAVHMRTAGPFLFAYDSAKAPSFNLLSPIRLGLWLIAIDFFFYIYHRSCHEVPALWFVHRTHHGTKHPTPLLTILADDYQDVIEIILVPVLASLVVPLNFAEGWAAVCYQIYVEMLGHSGIRANWAHPILSPILKPFGMELAVEDHDLHHRYGRGGKNYGKQTRIFDRILGTVAEREETRGL